MTIIKGLKAPSDSERQACTGRTEIVRQTHSAESQRAIKPKIDAVNINRSSLDRMIEEELSRRKSITSSSEKQEQVSASSL